MPTYIILLGRPERAKAHRRNYREKLGLAHVSSGDLFRENLKAPDGAGQASQGYMDRGELVPDDVTIAMIRERLQQPDATKAPCWMASRAPLPRPMRWTGCWRVWRARECGPLRQGAPSAAGTPVWTLDLPGCGPHLPCRSSTRPRRQGCDVDGTELYQRADDKPEAVADASGSSSPDLAADRVLSPARPAARD